MWLHSIIFIFLSKLVLSLQWKFYLLISVISICFNSCWLYRADGHWLELWCRIWEQCSSACFVTEFPSDFWQDTQPLRVPVSMCKISVDKNIKNCMTVMEGIRIAWITSEQGSERELHPIFLKNIFLLLRISSVNNINSNSFKYMPLGADIFQKAS